MKVYTRQIYYASSGGPLKYESVSVLEDAAWILEGQPGRRKSLAELHPAP